MPPPKGNKYWELAKGFALGADRKYNPEELWTKAIEYFEWVEDNPLKEQKAFASGVILEVDKIRAMSITGFCIYANIGTSTFYNYSKENAYLDIINRIKDIIYTQKFEGAAADLLNANIIAREIGLVDKQQTDITTNGESLNEKPLSKEELNKRLRDIENEI